MSGSDGGLKKLLAAIHAVAEKKTAHSGITPFDMTALKMCFSVSANELHFKLKNVLHFTIFSL